ncbi:MAG: hypothetical protein ACK5P5_00360 [Pseudobdellovibrionaceae bacterium]
MKGMVAGSSGLVGSHCVRIILQDIDLVSGVDLYGRKQTEINPKFHFIPADFQSFPGDLSKDIDFAVCALGTTIGKAGSSAGFQKVDHEFVVNFAKHARTRGAKKMILVSALGADEKSKFLYNRTKGKAEQDLIKLNFESLVILRPSVLLGVRDDFRLAEKTVFLFEPIYRHLMVGPLQKFRPIRAEVVAAAICRKIMEQTKKVEFIENDEILKLR